MKFIGVTLVIANLCSVALTSIMPMRVQPRRIEKAPAEHSVVIRRQAEPDALANFLDMSCFVDAVNTAENEPRVHHVSPAVAEVPASPEGGNESAHHATTISPLPGVPEAEHAIQPSSNSSEPEHVTHPSSNASDSEFAIHLSSNSSEPEHSPTQAPGAAETTGQVPAADHSTTTAAPSKKRRQVEGDGSAQHETASEPSHHETSSEPSNQENSVVPSHHANSSDASPQEISADPPHHSNSSDPSQPENSSDPAHHDNSPDASNHANPSEPPQHSNPSGSNETDSMPSKTGNMDFSALLVSNYVSSADKVKNNLAHYKKQCEDHSYKAENSEGHKCLKSCMLMQFHLINYDKASQHFKMTSDLVLEGMEDVDPSIFVKLLMLFGVDISSENKILAELTRKVVHDCSPVLDEVANVKKLPCNEWDPFVSCVENSWKCPGVK